MKKKILICTLCFTIIFSSLNIKKSYADAGVISLPMLSVVSSLAVGTGILIKNNDDLYDLGRMFYGYIDRHNDLTWATVQSVFSASVSLQPNKLVSVKSEFLDIIKNFLDDTFGSASDDVFIGGTPIYPTFAKLDYGVFGNYKVLKENGSYPYAVHVLMDDGSWARIGAFSELVTHISFEQGSGSSHLVYTKTKSGVNKSTFKALGTLLFSIGCIAFPYEGGYTWGNIDNKKENESVALPVPGDLGQLVGQGSSEFWGNTDNLVGNGDISIPSVSDPSISLDGTTSFPNTNVDTGNPSIPDTGNPSIPNNGLDIFPPWGGGIDFTPVTQSSFIDKFPFSLGNDIKNILNIFDVEPVAPRFKVPIVSETIELDLTEFEQLASIVRFFILVGFIISLILITRSVIG